MYGVHLHFPSAQQWWTATLFQFVPLGIWIAGTFLVPESPRYFLLRGNYEKASINLVRLRRLPADHPLVQGELDSAAAQIAEERSVKTGSGYFAIWAEVFATAPNRRRFALLFICHVLGQVSSPALRFNENVEKFLRRCELTLPHLYTVVRSERHHTVFTYDPRLLWHYRRFCFPRRDRMLRHRQVSQRCRHVRPATPGCSHHRHDNRNNSQQLMPHHPYSGAFLVDFFGRRRSLLLGISLQLITLSYLAIYLGVTTGRSPEAIDADGNALRASQGAIAAIYIHVSLHRRSRAFNADTSPPWAQACGWSIGEYQA